MFEWLWGSRRKQAQHWCWADFPRKETGINYWSNRVNWHRRFHPHILCFNWKHGRREDGPLPDFGGVLNDWQSLECNDFQDHDRRRYRSWRTTFRWGIQFCLLDHKNERRQQPREKTRYFRISEGSWSNLIRQDKDSQSE